MVQVTLPLNYMMGIRSLVSIFGIVGIVVEPVLPCIALQVICYDISVSLNP